MSESVSLHIEKLVPGGEGLARHEGRVVFVPGTLPGEDVRAAFTEVRKDFARARLLEILRPSPDRAQPPCPLAGRCGGCDWQHIRPEAQANLKVEMVRDALRRIGGLEWNRLEIECGPDRGYRNRLQLHADGSGAVGFLERGGHGFVPVKQCPVAHPGFAPLLAEGCAPGAPDRFLAFAAEGPDGSLRLWREDQDPEAEVQVTLLGKELNFPLRAFFQSNLSLLPRLISFAVEGLSGGTAWDLYAGVGLFGAMLKPHFRRVVCVESDAAALAYARRNVGEGVLCLSGRLEKAALRKDGPLREKSDAAIVDPPREGLAAEAREFLKAANLPRLVYVSCNPVTLARDLKDLLAGSYALEDLRLFDFFPHTSHVEAVAKLAVR